MVWCYTMPATPHPGAYFILTKVVARQARLLTSQMDKGSRGRRQALAQGHAASKWYSWDLNSEFSLTTTVVDIPWSIKKKLGLLLLLFQKLR